ncbi:cytochrome P450 [Streptomyces nojiriensis]|uniref:cytochrome P450 n=1 Tax=Streptomyces nojiriensis TaxID=66374 RepID=UPI0035D6C8A0
MDTPDKIPSAPGALPLLGHLLQLGRQPLEFLTSLPGHGDLLEIRLGPQPIISACSPELVWHLLRESSTFDKGGAIYRSMGRLVGMDSLVTSLHEPHRRRRRLMQPAFSPKQLAGYTGPMVDIVAASTNAWQDGQIIDIAAAMEELSVSVTTRILFDTGLADQDLEKVHGWMADFLAGLLPSMLTPSWLPRLPLPAQRRFERAIAGLRSVADKVIDQARREGADGKSLLTALLAARDEDGDRLSDGELRDQVVALIAAGTEPTSTLLCWTFHLLADHPQIARRLHAEVDQVLSGRTPAYGDLPRLGYTTRVLTEALRLYPTALLATRVATCDTELAGRPIPKDTVVMYSPWTLHRRPELYPDPDRFDPDRWIPERAKDLPRGAFVAFGGGARKCIADSFAMLQAALALAHIAGKWDFERLPHTTREPRIGFFIRPREPRLRLRKYPGIGTRIEPEHDSSTPGEDHEAGAGPDTRR